MQAHNSCFSGLGFLVVVPFISYMYDIHIFCRHGAAAPPDSSAWSKCGQPRSAADFGPGYCHLHSRHCSAGGGPFLTTKAVSIQWGSHYARQSTEAIGRYAASTAPPLPPWLGFSSGVSLACPILSRSLTQASTVILCVLSAHCSCVVCTL
jgi:hypothetical protein